MNRKGLAAISLGILALAGSSAGTESVNFEKKVLTELYYSDGIHYGDIDRDGAVDIVAGPFWYRGPDFRSTHPYYLPVPHDPASSPTNNMFTYVYDFSGDGWLDILVLGRVHLHEAFWYENPRRTGESWKKHFVFPRVQGESPPFVDLNGDGRPEVVCLWQGRWGWIQPDWSQPSLPWTFHPVTRRGDWHHFYHGTGVGDLNGDGRLDLILNDGWFEQPPPGAESSLWLEHPFRFAEKGGAQIYALDVDGDGDPDVVTSLDGHGWGLAWFEQRQTPEGITFERHLVMEDRSQEHRYGVAFSQPHALALGDLDGDGLPDLVTGKRVWAHGPTGDVEPDGPAVLYWFRLLREGGKASFRPHLIDQRSGVGVQLTVADVNGDGRLDILTASKLGAFVFLSTPSSF